MKWKRYRFETEADDYRPVVFDPRFPWWCSGYGENTAIIIAFLPPNEKLEKYWPEAENVEYGECDTIEFTDRFPKPDYFKDYVVKG